MGAIAALCTVLGMMPFAVLVIVVAMLLSWEWGRLVHGREGGHGDCRACCRGGAGGVAAFDKVGLGLLLLPIGAILATLLTLGRSSVFSALGVFYVGLPAVSLIWLRSDPQLGLLAVFFVIVVVVTTDTAGFVAGRLMGRPKLWPVSLPTRPGQAWSVRWRRARSSPPCSGSRFRRVQPCALRQLGLCSLLWRRPETLPSQPSSVASAPRIRAP